MESKNEKRQLIFSDKTSRNKKAMYLLFARKIENMIMMKNWKTILQHFDYGTLSSTCGTCGSFPCVWKSFGACFVELVQDFFDSTPIYQMNEHDRYNCRKLLYILINRIKKGYPSYLARISTPTCVVDGALEFFPQEAGNNIPIPNFNLG